MFVAINSSSDKFLRRIWSLKVDEIQMFWLWYQTNEHTIISLKWNIIRLKITIQIITTIFYAYHEFNILGYCFYFVHIYTRYLFGKQPAIYTFSFNALTCNIWDNIKHNIHTQRKLGLVADICACKSTFGILSPNQIYSYKIMKDASVWN